MKLVALVKAPAALDVAARVLAAATEMVPAEARMRLAPEPPTLLARLQPDAADALARALGAAGLSAISLDDRVPTDAERFVAERFVFEKDGARFTSRDGDALELPWTEVRASFRGSRTARTETTRTEKTKSIAPMRAILTGGLSFTKTSQSTVRTAEETVEQLILVYTADARAILLGERSLDFTCLGAALQPSGIANMVEIARRLRAATPGAYHDDRLLRLGRRPLPFVFRGESRTQTTQGATSHTDTTAVLDVLAALMHRGLCEGLLP